MKIKCFLLFCLLETTQVVRDEKWRNKSIYSIIAVFQMLLYCMKVIYIYIKQGSTLKTYFLQMCYFSSAFVIQHILVCGLKPAWCYSNHGVKITGLFLTQTQVRPCAVSNGAVVFLICSCLSYSAASVVNYSKQSAGSMVELHKWTEMTGKKRWNSFVGLKIAHLTTEITGKLLFFDT